MGILSRLLGKDEKKTAPKKKATTKKSTANKKVSTAVKDKFYITDLSEADKASTKAGAKKNQVRLSLYKKVQQAIENAKLKKPESKLGRLEKIFTINEVGKTIATIRYGSVIFYQGIMNEASVFDRHGKENFENKLGALNHLKIMLEADEWFDPQYENYLKTKETADKKSATTKKANKSKASSQKTATKATSTKKASAKKSTTKKSSTKKASAKTSAKKTTTRKSSVKASSKKK